MSRLLLVELLALIVVCVGIAMLSIPVALVVAGVSVIAACEVRDRDGGGG